MAVFHFFFAQVVASEVIIDLVLLQHDLSFIKMFINQFHLSVIIISIPFPKPELPELPPLPPLPPPFPATLYGSSSGIGILGLFFISNGR